MNRQVIVAGFLTVVLGSGAALYGLATEHIGPGPAGSQPDWPKGLTELAAHQTRVYSFWVNGNEDFYFWADADEVNELLALFAKMDMEQYRVWVRSEEKNIEALLDVDEHEVWIRSDKGQAKTFSGGEIEFNVRLHVPGGMALAFSRRKSPSEEPPEYPRLTVHLRDDQISWSQLKIPKNVVLQDASGIKAIGNWRRSEIRPFVLDRVENISLFYPVVVKFDAGTAYPATVETLHFKKAGSNLHCLAKVSEDQPAKNSFTLEVEVFGEQGSQKKITDLRGKGQYDLDFGPIGGFADAKQFAVTIARVESWGNAVNGVALRLTADKQLFSDDEVVSLKVEARNDGADKTLVPVHENGFQLVLDGGKYRWAPKDQLSFIVGYDNLAAGQKRADVPITVDKNEWFCNEEGQYLDIGPGEHTVQVVTISPASAELRRVASNPVPVWIEKKVEKVRRLYYGRIIFDDGSPAVVPSLRLKPSITKWYVEAAEGKRVVTVEDDGYFVAPISDEDMDRLKSGDCWLTVHFANDPWRQDASKDDQRFPVELLAAGRDKAGAVTTGRPPIYYGRIVFDDGTPPILDPEPWPGAKIHIDIPFDSTDVDEQGYFCVHFSDRQFEQLKARGAKFGIYCPRYEERQVSSEVAKFPVELMSTDKTKAGAVKIQKPTYKPRIDLANAPSLQGKALPEFGGIRIDFQPEHTKGEMLLICFWDMNQRPSRNCIVQLAKQAEQLKEKSVTVVAVQASKIDQITLDKWLKENKIPFPVGMIQDDSEKIRFAWGVRSLPWLILTDPNHSVTAEGFGLEELDTKVPAGFVPAPDAQSVMEKMRSFDEAFMQAHTLVVRMRTAANTYNQYERGQKLTKTTLTSLGGAIAVEREISYTDGPAYRKKTPGTEIDYRPDGSLIVWRQTRERSLMESDFQGHQSEHVRLLVSPDGQITELEGRPSFDFYRPSDMQRYVRCFRAPLWASGRGFADSLTGVTEARQTRDGLISFTAAGFLDPRIKGTWQMVVDPKADYIIRSACFIATGSDTPSFECTTSGTKWFDACCLAERANMGSLHDTVVVEQYKPEPNMVLLDQFRRILRGPLPEGVVVYDWRPNPQSVVPYNVRKRTMSEQDVLDETLDIMADIGSAPSLVGKSLPEFEALGVELQAAKVSDGKVLVCFFDMNQRPSRNCLRQLSTRAQELEAKDVVVVPIQAAKVDEKALDEWVEKNNIPFPVGMIQSDEQKTRFAWGVRSLPWLILTDGDGVVAVEGFGIDELDDKIRQLDEEKH